MTGREHNWLFVGGLDLGVKRDASALSVLAVPEGGISGKIRLAYHRIWQPTPDQKVDLLEVEKEILAVDERFNLEYVGFDPWNAEHLAATIEADTSRRRRNQRRRFGFQSFMREFPPTAANLRQQATLTIEFFNDRRFEFYNCNELRSDLRKLRVEERGNSFRLVSPRDASGHGDLFSAFAISLLLASEVGKNRPIVLGAWNDASDFSSEDFLKGFEKRQADYQRSMEYTEADRQRDRRDKVYTAIAQQVYNRR
jgi:hypothetical protein